MKKIYTDGSSCGNPGKGGYGICIFDDNDVLVKVEKQRYENTTNNQAELNGLLRALEIAQENMQEQYIIYCDSAYCVNTCKDWIFNWARNGWINSKKQEVKNIDLMKKLYQYLTIDFPNFKIEKVKGHNENIGNELADAAATNDRKKFFKVINEKAVITSIIDF